MACDEGRQAFTPPRGPFSLNPLEAPVPVGPPAGREGPDAYAATGFRISLTFHLDLQHKPPLNSSAFVLELRRARTLKFKNQQ
jgi:hypothetical protein